MIVARIIISFIIFNVTIGAKLPSDFIRCHINDQICLKKAIQDAIPKFAKGFKSRGVHGLDPLIIPKMEVPSGGAVVKMTQTYTDCQLIGLSTSRLDELRFDFDDRILSWKFYAPKLVFKGKFEIMGQILFLPVKGNGTMEIVLEDVKGGAMNNFEIIKRDNKEYFKLVNNTLAIDAEHIVYDFQNLFDGNKELGKQINQVLNDNSRDVFNELKDSYNRAFVFFIVNIADMFLSQVPVDEIILN